MKILVTGATGRIGHHLVDELLEREHQVRALVMPEDPFKDRIAKPGVEIMNGSLTDRQSLETAVKDVDAVYHLGALLPQKRTSDEIFEVNIRGTYNMLEAVRPHADRIQRFVFASTDATYWNAKGARYLPIDETHPRAPDNTYGMSKVLGEDMCWNYMRQCGLPVAIPRFGLTMEPHELLDPDGILGPRFFLKAILTGRKANPNPTPEEQKVIQELESHDTGEIKLVIPYDPQGNVAIEGMNDARNVAEALPLFLEKELVVGEVFNLAAGTPFAYDEYVKYISKLTGWPYVEIVFPSILPRWEISVAKARAMLGYNPHRDVFQMIDEGWEIMKPRFS